jgi:hypothetical protein
MGNAWEGHKSTMTRQQLVQARAALAAVGQKAEVKA